MKAHTLIVSVLILLLTVTLALARTWTAGTRTFEGKFLGLTDNGTKVRIEKTDGKRVKVALEKLSKEDQDFVKNASSRSADDDLFEPDDTDARGVAIVPTGNQYVLLIGVNAYTKPIKSLSFCVNDMKLLAENFEKNGIPKENIFLMTDESAEDWLPSGVNIRRQIENITGLMGPEDQLIIAFSGHGVMMDGKSYLCPRDTNTRDASSLVSRDWAFEQLEKCKAKQKIFIIDACRDEVNFGGTKAMNGAKALEDPIGADAHGFILIASCDKTQQSWEHEKLQHGVFTHFLAEGLAGAAKDEDGYVSVLTLFQYASAKTKKYVLREFNTLQVPTLRQSDEMTDFCVARVAGTMLPASSGPSAEELARQKAEKRAQESEQKAQEAAAQAEVERKKREAAEAKLRERQSVSGSRLWPLNCYAGDRVVLTYDGIKYAFRWCPPGEFTMGSSRSEFDQAGITWKSYDEQQHKVKLMRGFWLLETEVTQEMWESVMGNNPSNFKGASKPVEQVSWEDCQDFCRKLSQKLDQQVQLPTEAQWEYACRAGTTGEYAGTLDELGWYNGNSGSKTHKVDLMKPNAWGLYDMHGNVWEWCSDWYDKDYYSESPTSDPTGPNSGSNHVYRGGGWFGHARNCRSAYRSGDFPEYRNYDLGLRVLVVPVQ